jgi:hypothetical protein
MGVKSNMATIKCPKCDATCDSNEKVCHVCGYDLTSVENKEAVIVSDNTEIDSEEPDWVTHMRGEYKREVNVYRKTAIVFSGIFLVLLLVSIFGQKDVYFLYFMAGFIAFLAILFWLGSITVHQKITTVQVVDGYYVVGYGNGILWSLIIDGKAVDSTQFRKHGYNDDIVLKGILPNNQKIKAFLGPRVKNYMQIEKVEDKAEN